jgi:predicted acylesterase/phospholipase RssA
MDDEEPSIWHPDALVLGAPTSKVYYKLGVLVSIEKYFEHIHTFVGCSGGALLALLIACGFKMEEIIENTITSTIFRDMQGVGVKKSTFDGIGTMLWQERFKEMVQKKFKKVPTLKELHSFTKKKLIVIATNLSNGKCEYISWETNPDLSAITATFLSMNIYIPNQTARFLGQVFTDGMFSNPYPLSACAGDMTLGVCTLPAYKNTPTLLYDTIMFPIDMLKKRCVEEYNNNHTKNIIIEVDYTDFTGTNSDNKERLTMIYEGIKLADSFKNKLGIEAGDVIYIMPDDDVSKMNIQIVDEEDQKNIVLAAIFAQTLSVLRNAKK